MSMTGVGETSSLICVQAVAFFTPLTDSSTKTMMKIVERDAQTVPIKKTVVGEVMARMKLHEAVLNKTATNIMSSISDSLDDLSASSIESVT